MTRLLRTMGRDGRTAAAKPRALAAGDHAVVRIATARPVALEAWADNPRMARFVLRYGGRTVAAGRLVKVKR